MRIFDLAICTVVATGLAAAVAHAKPAKFDTPLADKVVPKKSNFDMANELDLLPLSLMPTDDEIARKRQLELDQEAKQIGVLWAATLDRSQDIQFVIHMLQADNSARSTSTAARLLSGAMFNAVQVAPMMFGGSGVARMGTGAAASMVDSLFNKQKGKSSLPQERVVYLYGVVRNTADQLVDAYRNYKMALAVRDNAVQNLEDIKALNVAASESDGKTASAAAYREYATMHAALDVREAELRAQMYRKKLVDLAGAVAVAELDQSIIAEGNLLKDLTGRQNWKDPLAAPIQRNASKSDPNNNP